MSRYKFSLILIFFVVLFVIFSDQSFKNHHSNQRKRSTNTTLVDLGDAITMFRSEFNRYPRGLEELMPPQGNFLLYKARVLDGWERPIKYQLLSAGGGDSFSLYSLGQNGIDEGGAGDDLNYWNIKVK